jgi:predicted acetyltransferase
MTLQGPVFTDFAALTDGVLALHPLVTPPAWPGYYFAIHLAGTTTDVGKISVRFDDDPSIALYAGNIAFEIDEQHRGHRYAARACRLLVPVVRHHRVGTLWIITTTDNIASRRTIETIGGEYVETLVMPPDTDMYALGMREARRHRWCP